MKLFIIGLWLCLSISTVYATLYEDAEDGVTTRWNISDATPANATITNNYDATTQSRVIVFQGTNYENQYTIGGLPNSDTAWNEHNKHYFKWSLKSSEGFLIDVILETTNGLRYIRYSDDAVDSGSDGEYIGQGVGYEASNGQWHEYGRDLEADLKEFEPNNSIVAVDGLQIRGSCSIDNIELTDTPLDKPFIIYEDAEDGKISRWSIVDAQPAGATVSNVLDSDLNSKVISLHGTDSYENQYQLGGAWNNSHNFNLRWDMKTTEGFIVDVYVKTALGDRYLRYDDSPETTKGIDGDTLFYGLGNFSTNGVWHTYSRDLEKDLKVLEPNNKLVSVEAFLIRANCYLDNIELFKTPFKVYEDAEDNSTIRWRIYNTSGDGNISNIYDNQLQSRVISLHGTSSDTQYIVGGDLYDDYGWRDTTHNYFKWSMKNSDGSILYLNVKTSNGNRYIKYDNSPFSLYGINGEDIHYGLGVNSTDDNWHTYIRDVANDIKRVEPNNNLISIEGFLVIGNLLVDDIELFSILHPTGHEAGLTLTFDDHDVDGWYSVRDIFLAYQMSATFFVDKFHTLTQNEIDKLTTLAQDGHEIGCHTYSHKGVETDFHNDVNRIDEYINEQIAPALDNMKAMGFNPTSLAYPYGEHESNYDEAVRAYFPYLRTTASDNERRLYQLNEIFHKRGRGYKILAGDGIDNSYNNSLEEIKEAFIKASREGEIITLYAHQILDDPNNPYAISASRLQKIIQLSKELGLKSYRFKESYLVNN